MTFITLLFLSWPNLNIEQWVPKLVAQAHYKNLDSSIGYLNLTSNL